VPSPIGSRRWLVLGLWLLVALSAARLVVVAIRAIPRPSYGFVAYYAGSSLLLRGAPGERFYDDDWFRTETSRLEPSAPDIFNANPPTMTALMLPIAWLDYRTARGVWIFFSLALFWLTSAWLVRRLGLGGAAAPGLLAIAALSNPVRENLAQGQVYLLLYALLTIAWWARDKGEGALLGASLGFVMVTKTAALPLWPMLAAERRWRALAVGAAAAALLTLALLPLTGLAMWRSYLTAAKGLNGNPLLAVTAYQSIFGFFHHLMGGGAPGVGAPITHAPRLAAIATWATGALLLAVSTWVAVRRRANNAVFAAFVLLGLLVSPVTSEAHFAMALLPIALLAAGLGATGTRGRDASMLFAGAFLVAAPLPTHSPALADGAAALLAYPKLYGALSLWTLAVVIAAREPPDVGEAVG
jgi:hypothetical protein